MKILLAADLHVEHSVKNDNARGERQSALVLNALSSAVKKHSPGAVVILGDLFDNFGRLESSIAVEVVSNILAIAESGIKIIIIAGNHDYPEVRSEFFGRSIVTALFGALEEYGIYVVDAKARTIRLDESHVVVGLPYRETYEQFEETCLLPVLKEMDGGKFDPAKDKVLVGWHVGLPFGTAWRGDEAENLWITKDHPAIENLFNLAHKRVVYCGHYHGPSEDQCGDGTFVYVGSPSTRSRSETGQQKRFLIWEGGKTIPVETGLELDHLVSSVDAAKEHVERLVERFGDGVLQVATVHVNLGDDASIDDYNVARVRAGTMRGDIRVDRPSVTKKGKGEHLVERHKTDPDYTREKMEVDMALLAVRDHFRGKDLKHLSTAFLESVEKDVPSDVFLPLLKDGNWAIEGVKKDLIERLGGRFVDVVDSIDGESLVKLHSYVFGLETMRRIALVV